MHKKFAVWTLLALVACSSPAMAPLAPSGGAAPQAATIAPDDAAGNYCKQVGGTVQMRQAWFTNAKGQQQKLGAAAEFCHFKSKGKYPSTIDILASTLYSPQPTLAAMAYYAEMPENKQCQKYLNDPAVCYCRQQLIGSDVFLAGGSWVPVGQVPNPNNRTPFCVFSDFSVIDSWGLTYHSAGIVRGIDLSKVLRFKKPT